MQVSHIQIAGNTISCPPGLSVGDFVLQQLELINRSRASYKTDIIPYTLEDVVLIDDDPSVPYPKFLFEISLCK